MFFLTLFVNPFVGEGAHGWVVDTAGHRGGSIQQGLGCWPTIGLFWAPVTSTCDKCCSLFIS